MLVVDILCVLCLVVFFLRFGGQINKRTALLRYDICPRKIVRASNAFNFRYGCVLVFDTILFKVLTTIFSQYCFFLYVYINVYQCFCLFRNVLPPDPQHVAAGIAVDFAHSPSYHCLRCVVDYRHDVQLAFDRL